MVLRAFVIAVLLACVCGGHAFAAEEPPPRREPAPEFRDGLEWFNTGRPLSLGELRGKFVLLDFWTYCCINCMHILPELSKLEAAFPEDLVVIGVHSAKFPKEKLGDNIREAMLRYRIKHPVVNDANMTIWRKFGVNSWPSLVVLDPEGQYCGYVSGEGNRELLEKLSQETKGNYYKPADAQQLAEDITYSEGGISVRETRDLWDMPALFLGLLLIRAVEWLLRRKWGTI